MSSTKHRKPGLVHVDYQLIYEARRFITGANIHRVKQMIFVYICAVELYNQAGGFQRPDPEPYERDLRRFVLAARSRN